MRIVDPLGDHELVQMYAEGGGRGAMRRGGEVPSTLET
jgi:hypothetical protein